MPAKKAATKSAAKQTGPLLIYGKSGWIGGMLGGLCDDMGIKYVYGESRLQNRESLEAEIDRVKPWAVMNAAGVTGRPNVDWCEDHKQETIRANVLGGLTLADVTYERGIHLTVFATGCIFEYDSKHKMYSGVGFKEEDKPNFDGSFYSETKGYLELMIKHYPNVLNLRVRMPISDDLAPRNFIYKISRYEKVVNIPNSMTILHDLLPVAIKATQQGIKGILNFTNPGVVSHNEILDLYTKYIDPKFTYKNFTLAEQDKILKSKRSNNELDTTLLHKLFPEVPHVSEGIVGVFQRMRAGMGMPPLKEEDGASSSKKGSSTKGQKRKTEEAPSSPKQNGSAKKAKGSAKKPTTSRGTTLAATVAKEQPKLRPVSRRAK